MTLREMAIYAILKPVVAVALALVLATGVWATRWLPERWRRVALLTVPGWVGMLTFCGYAAYVVWWGER